jgi:hypothetical protein
MNSPANPALGTPEDWLCQALSPASPTVSNAVSGEVSETTIIGP